MPHRARVFKAIRGLFAPGPIGAAGSSVKMLPLPNPAADYPRELHWRFEADALAWGNTVLAESTPCDVLIVDELGVLEFERGQGWQAGLTTIAAGDYRLGVVVIRPELLDVASQRWPHARVIKIDQSDQAAREADRMSREFLGSEISDGQIHHRLIQ